MTHLRLPNGALARASVLIAVIALLAGCAQAEVDPEDGLPAVPQLPDSPDAWQIVLTDPQGSWDECSADPAIASSDDADPASVSLVLVADSTLEDAERVRDCLLEHVTGGSVAISAPPSP